MRTQWLVPWTIVALVLTVSIPTARTDEPTSQRVSSDVTVTPHFAYATPDAIVRVTVNVHSDEEFTYNGYTWDWGDGSTSSQEAEITSHSRAMCKTHPYREAGRFQITISFVRDGNTIVVATGTAVVKNPLGKDPADTETTIETPTTK